MRCPDDSPCWSGEWRPTAGALAMWAQAAMLRTVQALPGLHHWRLSDGKGSRRTLLWCGLVGGIPDAGSEIVAVLTQNATEPELAVGDAGPYSAGPLSPQDLLATGTLGLPMGPLSSLASSLPRAVADALADSVTPSPDSDAARAYRQPPPGVGQWAGAMAQLPGTWLPPLAILPRSERDYDDPSTRWSTESLAFAKRHTVHANDPRYAADLLAPHVTALILEHVPPDAAVTIAGDAVHIWWPYDNATRMANGKVARTAEVTGRLRDALPSFVLGDHPDHSDQVQDRLAERAAAAEQYRSQRRAGRHTDPTLQRIYAQARAEHETRTPPT